VIRRVMEQAAQPLLDLTVKLEVEIGTGNSWGAAH
jgi:DNA polymerase-1